MLCRAVPPDRSAEFEKIRLDIFGIERKLEALQQSKEGAVPLKIEKAFHARAVPTDNGVRPSTRRKSKHKKRLARKGVEPKGRNLMVWKSKQRMHEMFAKGKLCGGAVPPSTLPTTSKLQTSSESKETVDCLVRKLPREQLPASPGLESQEKLSMSSPSNFTKKFVYRNVQKMRQNPVKFQL